MENKTSSLISPLPVSAPHSEGKRHYCTTREAAAQLGVSLRTVQLWVESGLLDAWKTEGGHRRVSRSSIVRLLGNGLSHPVTEPTLSLERMKVLVVEDDPILLKLYKTIISNWKLPIDVITAANGVEGLIRVGRDAPDLMITDLSMPGMDGFQLIRSLAASSFRDGMAILVVTGLEESEISNAGGLPPDIVIYKKPAPFNELRAIATEMIDRRASYL